MRCTDLSRRKFFIASFVNLSAYLPVSNGAFAVALFAGGAVGGGGLHSSVEDLFLWDQNFYNNKLGGGTDLISDPLSTDKLNNGEKVNYAFGLQVGEWKGLKWISHGGSGGGFRSEMIRFPSQNFSVICLCNAGYQIDPDELAGEVTEILLADQFKKSVGVVSETITTLPDVINISEKELASLAGLYFDPNKETSTSFYMKEGKLMIFNTVLSPLSQNRSVTPTSIQLTEFAGKYISHELGGAMYTLSINDTNLLLQVSNGITVFSNRTIPLAFAQPNGNEPPRDIFLAPTFADAFDTLVDGTKILIRFTRNRQNLVTGFKLSTGTVRRLRFDKQ